MRGQSEQKVEDRLFAEHQSHSAFLHLFLYSGPMTETDTSYF